MLNQIIAKITQYFIVIDSGSAFILQILKENGL